MSADDCVRSRAARRRADVSWSRYANFGVLLGLVFEVVFEVVIQGWLVSSERFGLSLCPLCKILAESTSVFFMPSKNTYGTSTCGAPAKFDPEAWRTIRAGHVAPCESGNMAYRCLHRVLHSRLRASRGRCQAASPESSGWEWSRGLRVEPDDHRCGAVSNGVYK